MTARRLISGSSILLTLMFVLAAPAWADSNVRIVRLSLVDGPVQLDRATGEGFERAIMNMPIAQGMQLWTRDDSRAEVEFEGGNTIRVAPGSKIEFSELVLRSDGSRHTVIHIDGGRFYLTYTRNSGEDFRIQFGNREIVLERSVHFRLDVENERAELAVFKGDLDLPGMRVKKNNTITMDLAGAGTYDMAKGVDAELEDAWDAYRRDYHDAYAKSAYKGSSFYGSSDLNYYGSWLDSPYGSCWRPSGFAASWDPYSSGAWAWYPGYGYSWVSLYPWGWQPYRSGAWNFLGAGYGYCWTPNRTYYGYGWAPVYYAPYGYRPVQPPAGGNRTPAPRNPGALGLLPVGNVNTTGNWRPTDPIILDRGGRSGRGGNPTVVSGRSGASASTGAPSATPARGDRGGRGFNAPPAAASPQRPGRGDVAPRPDRGMRQDRSFDRSAPSHSSPAPMSAPSHMSAAPAAPAHSAPSGGGGGGSRGSVPK
jgi:hypothetical protein